MQTKTITIRLPRDVHDSLVAQSEKRGDTVTGAARTAIVEGLARQADAERLAAMEARISRRLDELRGLLESPV